MPAELNTSHAALSARQAGGQVAPVQRLLLRSAELAAAIGVDERTLRKWSAAGLIGPAPLRISGTVRYAAREAAAWIDAAEDGVLPSREEWAALRKRTGPRGAEPS